MHGECGSHGWMRVRNWSVITRHNEMAVGVTYLELYGFASMQLCLGGHDDRGTTSFISKKKAEGSNSISSQCVYLVQNQT